MRILIPYLLSVPCSLFPVPCSLKFRNCVPHSYDNCCKQRQISIEIPGN
ncbi:MAG: hypothetical protein F6K55_31520 [Moorea sp. SIO4A3]|nr:hypothetical protein [Moorena sp. SIO4A3]NEQ80985.1 hypothetical protein [Moorena sp. SIO2I5]